MRADNCLELNNSRGKGGSWSNLENILNIEIIELDGFNVKLEKKGIKKVIFGDLHNWMDGDTFYGDGHHEGITFWEGQE